MSEKPLESSAPTTAAAANAPSVSQSQQQTPVRRPARSKTGCNTCRVRKVRCDETQPRCSHCFRLNLECRWRQPASPAVRRLNQTNAAAVSSTASQNKGLVSTTTQTHESNSAKAMRKSLSSPNSHEENGNSFALQPHLGAMDQIFDYASFMWDAMPATGMNQFSPEWPAAVELNAGSGPWRYNGGLSSNAAEQPADTGINAEPAYYAAVTLQDVGRVDAQPSGLSLPGGHTEDRNIMDYFIRTIVPPILAEVETQRRWSSMRQVLMSMSNSSEMVRCAILAFSSLLYHEQQASSPLYTQNNYDRAERELAVAEKQSPLPEQMSQRTNFLATLFFLSYTDILQGRVSYAHKHLEQAHNIFRQAGSRSFRPVEVRLLSWLRLLDARAVSAGGKGLFLSDNSEAIILVQPSPASIDEGDEANSKHEEVPEQDIEDVLFQALYHPGIVFFQKVQSFMGRISKIDPWHRSRGTIEDETEVMNIASRISKDLRSLYEERPVLMDHAVAGTLKPPHVSANLSYTITRAFRTYLANYHASKVHLHRVAYKNLPLARETVEALTHIRNLTRSMVETLEPGSALPVSQLWPLLMLGVEEGDPGERAWIREQILKMENVATNAKITAQVLDEVQVRQDNGNARVDIRSVMHDIFDSCFAIM